MSNLQNQMRGLIADYGGIDAVLTDLEKARRLRPSCEKKIYDYLKMYLNRIDVLPVDIESKAIVHRKLISWAVDYFARKHAEHGLKIFALCHKLLDIKKRYVHKLRRIN